MNVTAISKVSIPDQYILIGEKLNLYIAGLKPTKIKINGRVLESFEYSISNMILTIDSKYFTIGENTLEIDDEIVCVNLSNIPQSTITESINEGCGGSVIASIFGVLTLLSAAIVLRKKRGLQ